MSLVKEWIHDGQILCYRFDELSRLTMDSWYNDAVHIYRTWPDHKPLRLLIDARMKNPVISVHVVRRVREASSVRPQVSGGTAFLIASPAAAQLISGLLRTALPLGMRRRRVFSDEALAVEWLLDPAGG